MSQLRNEAGGGVVIGTALVVLLAGLAAIPMVLWPWVNVYHKHMEGKAQLAKAEYSKQVMVLDAKAREDSAKSLAQVEVTRAEGVAKANKIIGQSLENNEGYLHYLWIHNLEIGDHDVIYVPTEAGMPIFEAGGRFQKRLSEGRKQSGEPGTPEHPESDDATK